MSYQGNLFAGAILRFPFTTVDSTGLPAALSGTPALVCYKDDGTTESSAGLTLTAAFDGRVGLNMVKVDTSADGTFYSAGSDFSIILATGSVAGVFIGGYELGQFSIQNRPVNVGQWRGTVPNLLTAGLNVQVDVEQWRTGTPLGLTASQDVKVDVEEWRAAQPNVLSSGRVEVLVGAVTNGVIAAASFAANALDAVWSTATRLLTAGTNIVLAKGVGVTGFNDLDAAGVRSAVGLASANLDTQLAALQSDTDNIQTRLPTALTANGNIKADVEEWRTGSPNGLTAAKDVKVDVEEWIATVPNVLIAGRVDANVGAMQNNVVTAAAIATDAIGSDEIAATAVTEIQSGLATAAALATVQADTDDIQTRLPAALVGGRIDANVGSMSANVITSAAFATGSVDAKALATDAVAEIADGVWDEAIAGHLTAGSTGNALNAAGSAGDPWSTPIPGAYGAGTAGFIVGTNLDSKISDVQTDTNDIQTRLPATLVGGKMDAHVNDIAANAITATSIAADAITAGKIAADAIGASELAADAVNEIADQVWDEVLAGHLTAGSTGNALNAAGAAGDPWSTALPGAYGAGTAGKIVGDNVNATISSRSTLTQADIRTAIGLAVANLDTQLSTIAGYVDTEVAAIKAKTDQLTFTVANKVDSTIQLASDFAQGAADRVWSTVARTLTAGTNIVLAKGVGITGFNDLDASGIRTAVGLATANLDAQLSAIAGYIDTEVTTLLNRLGTFTGTGVNTVLGFLKAMSSKVATLPSDIGGTYDPTTDSLEAQADAVGGSAPTAAQVADAVWDEAIAGHLIAGSTGQALASAGGAADPLLNVLPGAYAPSTAGADLYEIYLATQNIHADQVLIVGSPLSGNDITAYLGTLWNITLTGLGNISAYTKLYFTVKGIEDDSDPIALAQVVLSNPGALGDGLIRINGASATATDGSINVNNATTGSVTIKIKAAANQILRKRLDSTWDLKMIAPDTTGPVELARGRFLIKRGETAAIS